LKIEDDPRAAVGRSQSSILNPQFSIPEGPGYLTSQRNRPKVCERRTHENDSEGRGRREMNVRFFPGTKKHKTSLIAGFLDRFRVEHELVRNEDYRSYASRTPADPAVEVDGRLFVDPNEDALKKILKVS
jgi:hypothetical protein